MRYLGYFVLFLERKCQEKNCEGGGESSDHQDTIEGARAVCPGDVFFGFWNIPSHFLFK